MSTLQGGLGADEAPTEISLESSSIRRRAPRVSQADVFRAADELLVQGDRPTIDRVRMRLGRGSPNTINDHLDAWWTKLGARLRDLPGREFPQLPERVASSLQGLWNTALEGAHEALQARLADHDQIVSQREQALLDRARELDEREHAANVRAVAVEESLTLARDQISGGQRRGEQLEAALRDRDVEAARLRSRAEALEALSAELRSTLDSASAAYQAERTRSDERHTATEARWLNELDRARQDTKESVKERERLAKDLRARVEGLTSERDQLREDLLEVRSELRIAAAVRQQLEERLREVTKITATHSSPAKRKGSNPRERMSRRAARTAPK
jgi:chromosome segregation ATPase